MAFRKTYLTIQPPAAIYACSDSIILVLHYCVILPAFTMCCPVFGLQRIILQTFQTRSKVRSVVAVQPSFAVGVNGLTLSSKPPAVIVLDGLKP